MAPYVLWFGKYMGKSVEQLMFDHNGYAYLVEFVVKKLSLDPSKGNLVERVREVVQLGEQCRLAHKCRCGNAARYFRYHGDDRDGFTFDSLACERCRSEAGREGVYPPLRIRFVPAKFSCIMHFAVKADRQQFVRNLKWALGAECKVTADFAECFFSRIREQQKVAAEQDGVFDSPDQASPSKQARQTQLKLF